MEKLDQWVKETWEKSYGSWKNRKQDLNYRKLLVRPALENEFETMDKKNVRHANRTYVDIGCGDGSETAFMAQKLLLKGFSRFYGFDISSELISHADRAYGGISFFWSDSKSFLKKTDLEGKVNLATSVFVLQDTPNMRELIEDAYRLLCRNGKFFSVIVNPQFAEAMKEKGELKMIGSCQGPRRKEYRFCAEYPIVEEGKKPFYVPYFHRSLGEYVDLIGELFQIDKVRSLKPTFTLQRDVSPFCPENHNVYWPEIMQIPSSVIIKSSKNE